MNGSRNNSRQRKSRHLLFMLLILPALAAILLHQAGVGQRAAVRHVGGSMQRYDFLERQQPKEISDIGVRMPPAPWLSSGSQNPVVLPVQMQTAVVPEAEKNLPSDLPNLPPGPDLGHGILPGQQNQDSTVRPIRLPPVLQSLGKALAPAPELNEGQGPAPLEHRIPLSSAPYAGEFDVKTSNGLVSLVAREAPLNEILSSIAQSERMNIICAEDITARISITLYEVTLEDALNAVLSTAGYTWVSRNGIIQVTSMSDATTLSPESQGRITEVFPLDYASAIDIDQVVVGLLSPAGQSFPIQASATDLRKTRETVVVEDLPSYMSKIREYIYQADQPPRQVLIEVHILEIGLEDDKKHGVNFEHLFSVAGNAVALSTVGFANAKAPQAFFATVKGGNLTALVEILQTTTDAKTLASPRLLVVNEQTARIQIGEQLGFRVITTTETSTMESVEFLDTGVVLDVTPHISRDNRVLMQVKPSVSSGEVNPDTGLPEEDTTEVETTVMLHDGQGILIGGLIQERDINLQTKIPFLGDLWMVGTLFQRRHVMKERSEIIISLVARVMPYEPCYRGYDHAQIKRSQTPLTYGPLRRYPRPFEPRLPDPILNPRPLTRLPHVRRDRALPEEQHRSHSWEQVTPNLSEPEVILPGIEFDEAVVPHHPSSP